MKTTKILISILQAFFLIALSSQSCALVVSTTSEITAWNGGLPAGESFQLDLNEFTQDVTTGNPGGLDLGPLTVEGTTTNVNRIDVAPFLAIGSVNGSPYLVLRTEADNNDQVQLRFDDPIRALGIDTGNFGGREGLQIGFTSNRGNVLNIPSDIMPRGFWGIISDEPIEQIDFIGTNPDGRLGFGLNFSVDNIRGIIVPEPSSTLLFLLSVIGNISFPRLAYDRQPQAAATK